MDTKNSLEIDSEIDSEIQEYFHVNRGLSITTESQLIFLGKENIQGALRFVRQHVQQLGRSIETNNEMLQVIASIKDGLIQKSESYVSMFWQAVAKIKDGELMPNTEISRYVPKNATTLNICGWCKYARFIAGSMVDTCVISPECNFLIEAGRKDNGRTIRLHKKDQWEKLFESDQEMDGKSPQIERIESLFPGINISRFGLQNAPKKTQRNFVTPCFLWFADEALLQSIKQRILAKNQELLKQKECIEAKIRYLTSCKNQAEEKPAFSRNRKTDWFIRDARVRVYVGDIDFRKQPETYWLGGCVCEIKENEDSQPVIIRLDDDLFLIPSWAITLRNQSSYVLHDWEYQYLREHPDFLEIWMKAERKFHPYVNDEFLIRLTK